MSRIEAHLAAKEPTVLVDVVGSGMLELNRDLGLVDTGIAAQELEHVGHGEVRGHTESRSRRGRMTSEERPLAVFS